MLSDEGYVRVGTRGWVYYLTNEPVDVEVVAVYVDPADARLYAKCDDGSGDTRTFRVEEIHPYAAE